MKEHPILFRAEMVRALLADRKHVTRRMSKQCLKVKAGDRLWVRETFYVTAHCGHECGVGYRADHPTGNLPDGDGGFNFRPFADDPGQAGEQRNWAKLHSGTDKWIPSIYMPRWASRILLECEEDARVERLQDITQDEARAEGVEPCDGHHGFRVYGHAPHAAINHYADPRASFESLWSTLHTKPGERWEDNPELVRVGRFRRVDGRKP